MTKEDWSTVTDRSQKKRIQNRVAQRTYRNRIKQRVEELEKEVSEYRRRAQEQQAAEEMQDGANAAVGGTINVHVNGNQSTSSNDGTVNPAADLVVGSCLSPNSTNITASPSNSINTIGMNSNNSIKSKSSPVDTDKDKPGGQSSSASSTYAIEMDTDADARLAAAASHEAPVANLIPQNNPVIQPQALTQPAHQRAQIQPQLPFTTSFPGLTSPSLPQSYNLGADWPWTNAPNSIYRDPIGSQPIPGFPGIRQVRGDHQDGGSDASFHLSPDNGVYVVPHSDHGPHLAHPEQETDAPTTSADKLSDTGSSDIGSPSSPASSMDSLPLGDYDTNLARILEGQVHGEQQLRDRSLEERFDFMRQCASLAGFNSIDDVLRQYYIADFSHESIMSREQRQSRHSQLPQLLSKLRKGVRTWTQWEAHRYQYEVIKSAQSVIHDEQGEFTLPHSTYVEVLSELDKIALGAGGDGFMDNAALSRAFRPLIKTFQDTSPKLWNLTESLVGNNNTLSQKQRTYTSLAVMLLLSSSNHMHKAQITALVTSCLDIAQDNLR